MEKLMPGILTLGKGTTRARAIVGGHNGSIRAVAQKPMRCTRAGAKRWSARNSGSINKDPK